MTSSRPPRNARRWLAAAVALLLPISPWVVAPASAAAGTTNVLRVWNPKYMERGGSTTRAAAVEEARHYDVIIAKPEEYGAFVADMRAANPRLKLFAYVNGTMAGAGQGSAFPDSWYLRDIDGVKVQSAMFGNYLMDAGNAGWVSDRVDLCRRVIATSGYDGCGLDVLGLAPVIDPTYVTAAPVNPRTAKLWTGRQWLAATSALAATVRSGTGGPVAGNGVGDGFRYFMAGSPTSTLLGGVDVGMAETFLRGGRSPLSDYPSVADWKANVDMLADAGARGKTLVVTTKVWNTGTAAEKDAWHKFALASFLLGADGRARFSFLYDITLDPATYHPWWSTALGTASGPYAARPNGSYARDFAQGKVVVNPTGSGIRVALGASYTTLDGRQVTAVTLPPHGGEVLTR